MNIILENIQSIKKATYPLPDTGFVQIQGGNSNGKSILVKTIGAVASLQIMDNEKRRALINDQSTQGSITIEYKGKVLVIILHEDRNQCIVALRRNNGEQITRTFRDGGIEELLNEFGFRTYNKNKICLQVYETFGLMPFVNTSTTENGEIVEAVTEDSIAKEFLTNFKEVTHKQAKEMVKTLNDKIANVQRYRESLLIFKYEEYERLSKEMREIYEVIKYLEPLELVKPVVPPRIRFIELELPELKKPIIPPRVEFVDFSLGSLTKPPIARVFELCDRLVDPRNIVQQLVQIKQGVCPTCGRPFIE